MSRGGSTSRMSTGGWYDQFVVDFSLADMSNVIDYPGNANSGGWVAMTVTGLPLGKIMGELRKDIDGKCDLDLRKRMAEALGWTDLFTAYSHEYKGRVLFGYRGSGVAEPVTDWLHDSIPYRCPVCNGSRFVMAELYGGLSSGTAPTEPCQSCGSTGVIWR